MECNISRRILELDIACSELRKMDNMISKADIIRLTGFNKTIYNEPWGMDAGFFWQRIMNRTGNSLYPMT